MEITYRKMSSADQKRIIELFYDFCELYRILDKQKININSSEYAEWCLTDMIDEINQNIGEVIVAEHDSLIVGFIGYFVRKTQGNELLFHRPHTKGIIYNVYVDEAYRNHEIGTHLLQLAEEYFRKNNCEFSKLQVFGTNVKAQKFYSRNEYVPRNIDLIKKL